MLRTCVGKIKPSDPDEQVPGKPNRAGEQMLRSAEPRREHSQGSGLNQKQRGVADAPAPNNPALLSNLETMQMRQRPLRKEILSRTLTSSADLIESWKPQSVQSRSKNSAIAPDDWNDQHAASAGTRCPPPVPAAIAVASRFSMYTNLNGSTHRRQVRIL